MHRYCQEPFTIMYVKSSNQTLLGAFRSKSCIRRLSHGPLSVRLGTFGFVFLILGSHPRAGHSFSATEVESFSSSPDTTVKLLFLLFLPFDLGIMLFSFNIFCMFIHYISFLWIDYTFS